MSATASRRLPSESFLEGDARDIDVNVDPVEQRAGKALMLAATSARPSSAPPRPATFTPMNDASVSGKAARRSSIVVRAQHRSERSFQEKKSL